MATGPAGGAEEPEASGIYLAWTEKYATYLQDAAGNLTNTDVMLLAEVAYTDAEAVKTHTAELFQQGADQPLAAYGPEDLLSYTNGFIYSRKTQSFDTLAALEQVYPANQQFVWRITDPDGTTELPPIGIGGPEGRTEIPEVSKITLRQGGHTVSDFQQIRPDEDIVFEWTGFADGGALMDGAWVDLNFLLVDNCHGEFVFTGGAPGGEKDVVLDYTVTSTTLPAGTLEPGMDYVVFLSTVNFREAKKVGIVNVVAANSFAVELPFKTVGETRADRTCPQPHWRADYRFSRKTHTPDGLVTWPTVKEIADRQALNKN